MNINTAGTQMHLKHPNIMCCVAMMTEHALRAHALATKGKTLMKLNRFVLIMEVVYVQEVRWTTVAAKLDVRDRMFGSETTWKVFRDKIY